MGIVCSFGTCIDVLESRAGMMGWCDLVGDGSVEFLGLFE